MRYAEGRFLADAPINAARPHGAQTKGGKMTRVIVDLSNDSRLDLLLAFLRRLGPGEIGVAVERNGQSIAFAPSPDDDTRFEAMVNQIIEDAMAGKVEPLTPQEEEREERELAEYGEEVVLELGVFTDDDIVRMINEDRAERREKAAA